MKMQNTNKNKTIALIDFLIKLCNNYKKRNVLILINN